MSHIFYLPINPDKERFRITIRIYFYRKSILPLMEKKAVKKTSKIGASSADRWEVLTQSGHAKKYKFACEIATDREARSIRHPVMIHAGRALVSETGKLLTGTPNSKFDYTLIDRNATYSYIGVNHLTAAYALPKIDEGGYHTTLMVVHSGFKTEAAGEKKAQRYV